MRVQNALVVRRHLLNRLELRLFLLAPSADVVHERHEASVRRVLRLTQVGPQGRLEGVRVATSLLLKHLVAHIV